MWQTYLQPTSLAEALELLEQHAGKSRIIVGGTDVLVEFKGLPRGVSTADNEIGTRMALAKLAEFVEAG